ncbi:hypothetical protein BGX29_001455 [Mortierella sp. GBA35]|nr:hypothetical protein BGX29_001455 [Mortierella sp. GBA35]
MAPQHVENLDAFMKQMQDLAIRNRKADDGSGYAPNTFFASKIVEADEDSATFEYTVQKSDCNFVDSWHGGAIAGLIDNLTTAVVFTQKRKYFKFAGVSSDLHITYVSAAPLGAVVLIECKVTKVGAGLANTMAIVKNKATGRIIATALHTKFNNDSKMAGVKL